MLTQSEHHIKTFKAIRAQFTWNAELHSLSNCVWTFMDYLKVSGRLKLVLTNTVQKRKHPNHNNYLRLAIPCCIIWKESYIATAIQTSPISCSVIPSPCEDYACFRSNGCCGSQFPMNYLNWYLAATVSRNV